MIANQNKPLTQGTAIRSSVTFIALRTVVPGGNLLSAFVTARDVVYHICTITNQCNRVAADAFLEGKSIAATD